MIVRSNKSSAESVRDFYRFLYDQEEVDTELVEYYERLDEEFTSMESDLDSVEEQVDCAEEEREEMRLGLQELKKNFKGMKRAEIYAEIERLLI
jgi:hypothetical protein